MCPQNCGTLTTHMTRSLHIGISAQRSKQPICCEKVFNQANITAMNFRFRGADLVGLCILWNTTAGLFIVSHQTTFHGFIPLFSDVDFFLFDHGRTLNHLQATDRLGGTGEALGLFSAFNLERGPGSCITGSLSTGDDYAALPLLPSTPTDAEKSKKP
ncbi:hypothetical protein DPSP01_008536 [Paraphaeosphaeria sporulosa]